MPTHANSALVAVPGDCTISGANCADAKISQSCNISGANSPPVSETGVPDPAAMANKLYYGDNLDVLRSSKMRDETVDLCYIDPPFNSKRTYNQIYTNRGEEDRAQAQAFVDTWTWDDRAKIGFPEILNNHGGLFTQQTIDLMQGLRDVLSESPLLAYLVSITLRVAEIHRVLKPTGTFYLHCDPTCSHYLKLVLDSIFCGGRDGDFRNEIIWAYESGGRATKDFSSKHDVVFRYTKSNSWVFNGDKILLPREATRHNHMKKAVEDGTGRVYYSIKSNGKIYKYYADEGVIPSDVWTDCSHLQQKDPERVGYPTQKPKSLLRRMILASTNEGDLVLDAYCGCGTTVAVAQELNRKWIGMDITYQSISVVLKRLEQDYGKTVADGVILDGIPRDMESAEALAHKKDDRLSKEFEKWAVLTYTSNRAIINQKKGADRGIDGVAYILTDEAEAVKMLLQVKSGGVSRDDIATLRGDMQREGAKLGTLITLKDWTAPMRKEAKTAGTFTNPLTGQEHDRIAIVTVKQIVQANARLDSPVSLDALWKAKRAASGPQMSFTFVPARKPAVREVTPQLELLATGAT